MKKREARLNTILNQYFRERKLYCYYELKQTNLDSFRFCNIESVQWEGLPAAEKEGMVYKWSDEISRPKPCDGASLPPLPSYVIIKFKDAFYFIRIGKLVEMRDQGYISISRSTAETLSDVILKI